VRVGEKLKQRAGRPIRPRSSGPTEGSGASTQQTGTVKAGTARVRPSHSIRLSSRSPEPVADGQTAVARESFALGR